MERTNINDGFFMYDLRSPGYDMRNREYNNTEFTSEISAPHISTIFGITVTFIDCTFNEQVTIVSNNTNLWVLTFTNCIFEQGVVGENAVIDGKVRFRNCHFKGDVNFRNTTFNNITDFWNSTFYKPTTFYKTDFKKLVVFSAATFKENVLFTYSLFGGKTIFGRTLFEKGYEKTVLNGLFCASHKRHCEEARRSNLIIRSTKQKTDCFVPRNDGTTMTEKQL